MALADGIDIHLASQPPRRRELLAQIGIRHDVIDVEVDDTPRGGEAPAEYGLRLALAKARAGHRLRPDRPVLGADTAVVQDDRILGKPLDRQDAAAMLAPLSCKPHLKGNMLLIRFRKGYDGDYFIHHLVDIDKTFVGRVGTGEGEEILYQSIEPLDFVLDIFNHGFSDLGLNPLLGNDIDGSLNDTEGILELEGYHHGEIAYLSHPFPPGKLPVGLLQFIPLLDERLRHLVKGLGELPDLIPAGYGKRCFPFAPGNTCRGGGKHPYRLHDGEREKEGQYTAGLTFLGEVV